MPHTFGVLIVQEMSNGWLLRVSSSYFHGHTAGCSRNECGTERVSERAVFLDPPLAARRRKSLWTGKWAKKIILTRCHVGRCSYLEQVEQAGREIKISYDHKKCGTAERRTRKRNVGQISRVFASSRKGVVFRASSFSPRYPINTDQNCFHQIPFLSAPFMGVFLLALSSHHLKLAFIHRIPLLPPGIDHNSVQDTRQTLWYSGLTIHCTVPPVSHASWHHFLLLPLSISNEI